jgi:hypothetical protein
MDSDREIQAVLANPATSCWLSDALKAGLKRAPLGVANDAEFLAKRAQEKAAQAMAWLAVQRAASGE